MFSVKFIDKQFSLKLESLDQKIKYQDFQEYDYLNLNLSNELLTIVRFELAKEKNIAVDEQIKWFLNAQTNQPLEEYYLDYQIFSQTEDELLGLAALVEKTAIKKLLESFTSRNIKVARINSEDEQFLLLNNKIYFWQKLQLVQTFNKLTLPLLLSLTVLLLAGAVFFMASNNKVNHQLDMAQEKIKDYQQKYLAAKLIKKYQQQKQENQALNETSYQTLYALTQKVPRALSFSKLDLDQATGLINIAGQHRAEMKELNGFIKDAKKIKKIKTINLLRTIKNNNVLDFEIAVDFKRGSRQRIAKKTKDKQKNV